MTDSTLLTLTVTALFFLLILLPMIPMLKTIYKKEDSEPLYMDLDYTFNPRFQVENFEKILPSKSEYFTEIVVEKEVNPLLVPSKISHPLLFSSLENVTLEGKIPKNAILYTKADIVTQPHSEIFALKSDANIVLGEKSIVTSWIDAAKDVIVKKDTTINLLTAKSVRLYSGVTFKRIYADTVGIYPLNQGDENKTGTDIVHEKKHESIEEEILYFEKNDVIKKGSYIHSDIICKGKLIIEDDCRIFGSVKTNGTLQIGNNTFVYGNIFSDKKITIKDNCFIFGNIFSHTYLEIGQNGQIGRYSLPKSIIGIKGITIAKGTFLHNYILTYGEGRIV